MRSVLTACLLLCFLEGMPAGELRAVYRQTASSSMLTLLLEDGSFGTGEVNLIAYPDGAAETGFRFRTEGRYAGAAGRFVYAGPLRLLADPSKVIMPSDLAGGRRWSVYRGKLFAGRTAFGITLEGSRLQLDGFLDLERSLAGAMVSWSSAGLSAGTAAAFRWGEPRMSAPWWRYRQAPAAGAQLMHLAWAAAAASSLQLSLAGAWSGGGVQPFSWMLQAAGRWEPPLFSLQAGIFSCMPVAPLWNILGEEADYRFRAEGDLAAQLPGPLAVSASGAWKLKPIPPWPKGRHLPGEAYAHSRLTVSWDSAEVSAGWKHRLSWGEGAPEAEGEIILEGSAETGVLKGEFEAGCTGIDGKGTGTWGNTKVSLAASVQEESTSASVQVEQIFPWGTIAAVYDSSSGMSISAEASGVLYSR